MVTFETHWEASIGLALQPVHWVDEGRCIGKFTLLTTRIKNVVDAVLALFHEEDHETEIVFSFDCLDVHDWDQFLFGCFFRCVLKLHKELSLCPRIFQERDDQVSSLNQVLLLAAVRRNDRDGFGDNQFFDRGSGHPVAFVEQTLIQKSLLHFDNFFRQITRFLAF